MTIVSYQIVFTEDKDVKQELVKLLKSTFEDNYDEFSEEELDDCISIKYNKKIDECKYLIGFDLIIEEIGTEIGDIISKFNDYLNSQENISLIIKFYDDNLYEVLSQIYKEIFSIEMRLREAVTLIFIDTYKSDYYNLLKDLNIKLQFDGKNNLKKDAEQKRDYLSKKFENEFFHIMFSDYIKLSNPRALKQEDLFSIAKNSNDFAEFKENIINRGVTNSDYISFIDEIKQIMDRLERIRNSVAHNRTLSDEDIENYETYFEQINSEIDKFFKKIIFDEEENEE